MTDLINNINAAELWFLRRIVRILYLDSVTNMEVFRRACVEWDLILTRHVVRNGSMGRLVLQVHWEGKQTRGRQQATYLDHFKIVEHKL